MPIHYKHNTLTSHFFAFPYYYCHRVIGVKRAGLSLDFGLFVLDLDFILDLDLDLGLD